MILNVFNVEHGACALLTTDDGRRMMIDCGHNATTGWMPGSFLKSIGVQELEGLLVTNYDEDHVSGIRNLFANVRVPIIYRNMNVPPATIRHLKTKDGMGPGIEFLVETLERWARTGGSVSSDTHGLPGVQLSTYCNTLADFDDENNLSMVAELRLNGVNFLFTGDMETAGWRKLLDRTTIRDPLARNDVFFASHHGRLNGCCDEVFQACKPRFVVISDKAKGFQTQETTDYYRVRSLGGTFRDQKPRHVLTTRSDGDMTFEILPGFQYLAY